MHRVPGSMSGYGLWCVCQLRYLPRRASSKPTVRCTRNGVQILVVVGSSTTVSSTTVTVQQMSYKYVVQYTTTVIEFSVYYSTPVLLVTLNLRPQLCLSKI